MDLPTELVTTEVQAFDENEAVKYDDGAGPVEVEVSDDTPAVEEVATDAEETPVETSDAELATESSEEGVEWFEESAEGEDAKPAPATLDTDEVTKFIVMTTSRSGSTWL